MRFRTQNERQLRDEEAARLVVKVHDAGDPDVRAAALQWMSRDPANAVAYARAEAAWEAGSRLRPRAGSIDEPTAGPADASWISRRAIAAGLIAASGLALSAPYIRRALSGGQFDTGIGQRRELVLADGSVVRLNTASRVEVALTAEARTVRLLAGEALFDVAHDPARPFFVEVAHSRIRAVGTAFNIRMRSDVVELTVTEGVVAVAGVGDRRPLSEQSHVAAGGSAAIRPGAVATTSLNPDSIRQRTAWREGVIELEGETVEQAVAEFNRYRTAPLVIGDTRIAMLRIGGRFGTSDSDRFIVALQQSLPIQAIPGSDGSVILMQAD